MDKMIRCRICGEEIDEPTEIELEEGVCLPCLEEMAEDVDNASQLSDEFVQGELDNEERRLGCSGEARGVLEGCGVFEGCVSGVGDG